MRRMVFVTCLFAAACGASVHSLAVRPAPPNPAVDLAHVSCARARKTPLPARPDDAREGSTVVLARGDARTLAYIADADSRSIHVVSVDDAKELGHTRLTAAPHDLLVLADGRLVVTLTGAARIAVLEPADDPASPMTTLCERTMPDEPWGVARSRDDTKLVVTSAWGAALTVLDATTFATLRTVSLSRDPRGVLVDDENVAFVSHAVGAKLTTVDLKSDSAEAKVIDLSMRKATPLAQKSALLSVRSASQGFTLARVHVANQANAKIGVRILVPMVSVDPGESTRSSPTYYGPPFDGVPKETPVVGVVDAERKEMLGKELLGTTDKIYRRECLLPRASAVRAETSTLYVACNGIDAVLALDALAVDPFRAEKARFSVPPGPEGVALDAQGKRLVVFSQLGAAVTVIALDDAAAQPKTVALDYHPDEALAAVSHGRQLFFRTDDARIADDGLACASCHIDGREDGITWSTPLGPRQTPMLAGRLNDTAPYGWAGDKATLDEYIQHTVMNLGGTGLPPDELAALSRFLLATRGPAATQADDAAVRRGHELFSSSDEGCSTCHLGMTGADGSKHLVATGGSGNDILRDVDTPALRFVVGTAPYFHDGRYRTLEDLLADPSSSMGHSALLSSSDQHALAAYLRTL